MRIPAEMFTYLGIKPIGVQDEKDPTLYNVTELDVEMTIVKILQQHNCLDSESSARLYVARIIIEGFKNT